MSSRPSSRSHIIYTIAVIGFIYTLHVVIPMYSNSSFLSLFADERTVGFIYMAGAALSIFAYLIAPHIIRKFGNYQTALVLTVIQMALFIGLVTSSSPTVLTLLFIAQTAIVSLISLCLDIFLEVYTDGGSVGRIRGFYTAVLNASWLVGPLIGSMLIDGGNDFRSTYVAALAMLFPLLYLIHRNFPRFHDPNYIHLSPWQLVKHVWSNENWIRLFFANIILQTFYSWMVVYSPIYLNKTVGFDWQSIGIILVIMLIPFPLIQYPLGRMTDGTYSIRRIMAWGFAVMGVSTMALSFFSAPNISLWAGLLFLTRVGAAAAEVMMETYFFKTVSPRDTAVLGVFRITRPFSYFLAPLVTLVGLSLTDNAGLFVVLGMICLVGIYPALRIKE